MAIYHRAASASVRNCKHKPGATRHSERWLSRHGDVFEMWTLGCRRRCRTAGRHQQRMSSGCRIPQRRHASLWISVGCAALAADLLRCVCCVPCVVCVPCHRFACCVPRSSHGCGTVITAGLAARYRWTRARDSTLSAANAITTRSDFLCRLLPTPHEG